MCTVDLNPATPTSSELSGKLPSRRYPFVPNIDLTAFAECVNKASMAAELFLKKGEISPDRVKEFYPVWLTVLGQAIELRILSEKVVEAKKENSSFTSNVLDYEPKKSPKHAPLTEFPPDSGVYKLTDEIIKCFKAVMVFQRHYIYETSQRAVCPSNQFIDKIFELFLGYFNEIPVSLVQDYYLGEKELQPQKEVGNILEALFELPECKRLGQRTRNLELIDA